MSDSQLQEPFPKTHAPHKLYIFTKVYVYVPPDLASATPSLQPCVDHETRQFPKFSERICAPVLNKVPPATTLQIRLNDPVANPKSPRTNQTPQPTTTNAQTYAHVCMDCKIHIEMEHG